MTSASGPLVLASRSSIRQRLLAEAGVAVLVDVADVDEHAVGGQVRDPSGRALALAAAKALAVSARRPGALVLGADQVGVLDEGSFLDKPRDPDDHVRLLLSMAGRTHTFLSAAALARDGVVHGQVVERAAVTFRAFDERMARLYVATGEGAWCCGGYESEHRGAQLIERVDGSLHAVLGLPLFGVLGALRSLAPDLLR
ncbi:MAG: septum formation protein Maf [Deltaproteobacteria bacterium]|nr:septum formation protein Maf [Deltaproteobacteria bacterium]